MLCKFLISFYYYLLKSLELDPLAIFEKFEKNVDAVINYGYGKNVASTIIDLTLESPVLIRQGAGIL